MQNDKIYSDILRYIKTKSDADELLVGLDRLSESLYLTEPTAFERTLATLKAGYASAIRDALEKGADKSTLLSGLREKIISLKPLKLTLAFEPTAEFIEKLHEWTADNLGEEIVLDFEVNPKIIAGAVISYSGRYFDFSLSRLLNGQL